MLDGESADDSHDVDRLPSLLFAGSRRPEPRQANNRAVMFADEILDHDIEQRCTHFSRLRTTRQKPSTP